jgi:hypothetical protein
MARYNGVASATEVRRCDRKRVVGILALKLQGEILVEVRRHSVDSSPNERHDRTDRGRLDRGGGRPALL